MFLSFLLFPTHIYSNFLAISDPTVSISGDPFSVSNYWWQIADQREKTVISNAYLTKNERGIVLLPIYNDFISLLSLTPTNQFPNLWRIHQLKLCPNNEDKAATICLVLLSLTSFNVLLGETNSTHTQFISRNKQAKPIHVIMNDKKKEAYLRHKYIHGSNSLSVIIDPHVKFLDVFWIVVHN